MLCCAVLCCAVLYCAVLRYIVADCMLRYRSHSYFSNMQVINFDTEHFKKTVIENVGEMTFQEGEHNTDAVLQTDCDNDFYYIVCLSDCPSVNLLVCFWNGLTLSSSCLCYHYTC